jgi:pyruvate/2-oxoglutarate dehydrogenase complex dihydrolipoamide dehydrogenase (E3) component
VRAVRAEIYEGEKPEVFEAAGIDVFIGEPCFVDSHTITIADRTLTAKHFVIATGSHPFTPPIPGLADIDYLTNETLFERETLPDCLFVLGGGPIGVEMAAALSRLGVKVTVLQRGPRILPRDDEELVDILTEHLRGEGLEILTGCEATGFTKDGERVHVTLKDSAGTEHSRDADCVLVAVGRRPNTQGLDLEKAGVDYSDRGIVADEHMRTTAKNIYAVGDVIGSYQFSHIAEYHANIAVPNALLPIPVKRSFDHTNVAWATFTDPELAHAGLTEAEADLSTEGLSKFVCDSHGKILGIHILGERAADLLHEAQLARFLGVPLDRIHEMVHIYPTYGDAVKRPAVAAYVDRIKSSPLVRIASAFSKSN